MFIFDREILILFVFLLTASLFDISRYRVPNFLLALTMIYSLFWRMKDQGFSGIGLWLLGMIVPFLICYLFYRCRMLGASDVKMFSVIGSFVGLRLLCSIIVSALFIGAAMAIVKMIIRKNFMCRFRQLFNYVTCCVQERKLKKYYDMTREGDSGIIPFAVAISLATILCVY